MTPPMCMLDGPAKTNSEAEDEGEIGSHNPVNPVTLENVFSYHSPNPVQVTRYNELRAAAKDFAFWILANCPDCADRAAALRKVREALMTANASIALDGKLF